MRASLVPFGDGQWVTLGFHTVDENYGSLRVKPADLRNSGDAVDWDLTHAEPGSASHAASMEALKNVHREVILFVNDVEREGLQVQTICLGAGLFNLLPESQDPQKEQRRHQGKAEKYVLQPGHFLPNHCFVFPALHHVR